MTIRKLVGTWKTKALTLTRQQGTGSTGTAPNMLTAVILMQLSLL